MKQTADDYRNRIIDKPVCAICSEKCEGLCKVSIAAIRGEETLYPYGTKDHQFGSQKQYKDCFENYNINGRIFGAFGVDESERTNVNTADTRIVIGNVHKIKCTTPIILPAIAKLDWQDYYAAAAMYGIIATIGESAFRSDPTVRYDNGRLVNSDQLKEMVSLYRKYQHGYGDIVFQVSSEDISHGAGEYALKNCDISTIEIKFGQAAKGIQHMGLINSLEEAQACKDTGYIIDPDPYDEDIINEYNKGYGMFFYQYGRMPMWTEKTIHEEIQKYRGLGAKNIFFKMAGFSTEDIERVIKIASDNKIDLITFDGAGGGTGHSPVRMMREWGYPTVTLEKIVVKILKKLKANGQYIPQVSITGGITTEDEIYKALALGDNYITCVAIGRAAMTAAMSAKNLALSIDNGKIPDMYADFGSTVDEIFRFAKLLKHRYGNTITPGMIGLYSYLERLTIGLKQCMALSRKFKLSLINSTDIIKVN